MLLCDEQPNANLSWLCEKRRRFIKYWSIIIGNIQGVPKNMCAVRLATVGGHKIKLNPFFKF